MMTTFEAIAAMLAVSVVCALWAIWQSLVALHKKLDRLDKDPR